MNDAFSKDSVSTNNFTYDATTHEQHWQKAWGNAQVDACPGNDPAYYVLEMFPYPSGALHMGHVRNYTLGDVFARFARLQGKKVLHPMGWDALGLPAENQAIIEKIAPQVRTPKNIEKMKSQMQRLGLSYDWTREIGSYRPDYYRWNQWFFLEFFKRDLVYRRTSKVNWCPGCQTILANEQVNDDKSCWRGHAGVTTREIPEWAFRITHFAQELLDGLETLTQWPERIVSQQRHWIGKSQGARVHFAVQNPSPQAPQTLEIFTTRIDTIYGCSYIVLAPEHQAVAALTSAAQQPAVDAFVQQMRQQDEKARLAEDAPKQGVFTGSYALHPFTHKPVPIWLANFVLADYGTGAVMAVPAHDARDFAFAQKYDLPIVPVVAPDADTQLPTPLVAAFTEDGIVTVGGKAEGMPSALARQTLLAQAAQMQIGEATTQWHLRDWGFSRQRYWGTPIPIIYCDTHGAVGVAEEDLPVVLPDFADIELTGQGGAPLAKQPSFYETTCPKCHKPARRETETMDTFVDSAWYFARFLSPQLTTAPFDTTAAQHRLPVNIYVGGPEHAVMHLLYFRFWTRVMKSMGLVNIDEPVERLITQGMVNAPTYHCAQHGYIPAEKFQGNLDPKSAHCPTCNNPLAITVEKMSKSKYNGIDPMHLIARYGADTARLYVLFAAPPEKNLEWNSDGVEGLSRFVNRIWRLSMAQPKASAQIDKPLHMGALDKTHQAIRRAVHQTLARVTDELQGRNHFNTAIAALMELVNTLYEHKLHEASPETATFEPHVVQESLCILAQMLTPFAPHLAESIWQHAGGQGFVVASRWPTPDPAALQEAHMNLAVQVQGKLRGNIQIQIDADQAAAEQAARADANVARFLEGQKVVKVIYVPKRLLNFVVKPA